MLYFAYGSNMHWQRMVARCPSAKFISVAAYRDHRLAFTRKCEAGHGVADVVETARARVWGVVYRIDDIDLGRLDKCEGYRPQRSTANSYRRIEIMVFSADDGEQPITCWTYEVINKAELHIQPSQEYLEHIITGAKDWGLPKDYIEQLCKVEVMK